MATKKDDVSNKDTHEETPTHVWLGAQGWQLIQRGSWPNPVVFRVEAVKK
jgi:hypothetical protein